jgi:hypothetical protein
MTATPQFSISFLFFTFGRLWRSFVVVVFKRTSRKRRENAKKTPRKSPKCDKISELSWKDSCEDSFARVKVVVAVLACNLSQQKIHIIETVFYDDHKNIFVFWVIAAIASLNQMWLFLLVAFSMMQLIRLNHLHAGTVFFMKCVTKKRNFQEENSMELSR